MLGLENLEEIMESHLVSGKNIMHNCLYINKSGVVTNIDPNGKSETVCLFFIAIHIYNHMFPGQT